MVKWIFEHHQSGGTIGLHSAPEGWDKGLCSACNEYYESGQLKKKRRVK